MEDPDIAEIIDETRRLYADRLISEYARLRAGEPDRLFTEAALRGEDGKVVGEGPSQLGCRVDAIALSSGESVMVDSTTLASFAPISIPYDDTPVALHPFQWDWCVVTLHCAPGDFRWQSVLDWFNRWFDAEDENEPDEDGLLGVIHFLSEPEFGEASITFTADLGPPPSEAFDGLIAACTESHPSLITIANAREPESE